jgi:hypothetical protein
VIRELLKQLTAGLAERLAEERVTEAERLAVEAGALPGIDLSAGPELGHDGNPLARLHAATTVSRDFRTSGKGQAWDRVKVYPAKPYGYPRNKQRGQSRGVREWSSIDKVVLHTAGVDGLHPDRWLGVPTHGAVADDATVVLCHELTAYLYAAHELNRRSVSIEVAGNRTISAEQVEPGRALIRYYVEQLREHHDRPLYLSPHRHGHSSRGNDCDAAIWRELGEWAIDTLGLQLGEPVGSGRPIPASWWSPGRMVT